MFITAFVFVSLFVTTLLVYTLVHSMFISTKTDLFHRVFKRYLTVQTIVLVIVWLWALSYTAIIIFS